MSTLANETRSENWSMFRLRGTLSAVQDVAGRIPHRYGQGASGRYVTTALREAESNLLRALQFAEADRYLQREYEVYRDSLWRAGDHVDCPIPKPVDGAIHSTMRLGDAWAQVVRRNGEYVRQFSFGLSPTTILPPSYRRAKDAQRAAAHRVLRDDTRDPRTCPFPGDRWTGDRNEPHLIVELVHPVRVQVLDADGKDLTETMLYSRVVAHVDNINEIDALEGREAPPLPTVNVLWLVRYTQAPHTGPAVSGLPNEVIEVPFGPTWPCQTFAGATLGTTRHVLVDAQTLPQGGT